MPQRSRTTHARQQRRSEKKQKGKQAKYEALASEAKALGVSVHEMFVLKAVESARPDLDAVREQRYRQATKVLGVSRSN